MTSFIPDGQLDKYHLLSCSRRLPAPAPCHVMCIALHPSAAPATTHPQRLIRWQRPPTSSFWQPSREGAPPPIYTGVGDGLENCRSSCRLGLRWTLVIGSMKDFWGSLSFLWIPQYSNVPANEITIRPPHFVRVGRALQSEPVQGRYWRRSWDKWLSTAYTAEILKESCFLFIFGTLL
jgi:hypothetical protein